ncbi:hypothetical protein [Aliiroseovarius sediminis]|uniref:hypothetical protein n=1 Tax=Aliiroseovarius sediminis TaxID=2925839 RepID=UPI001F5A7452|nr:hypothetical protein [Aliiroseovarius sediminis]MCI2393312.1 hypothetical protein [Aliiroseovarius sediminis]
MTYSASKFVADLKASVSLEVPRTVQESLSEPVGRRPDPNDVVLSEWYNGLTEYDKKMIGTVVEEATRMTLFSVLTILDGADVISEELREYDLRLTIKKGDEEILLSSTEKGASAKELEFLHDLFYD